MYACTVYGGCIAQGITYDMHVLDSIMKNVYGYRILWTDYSMVWNHSPVLGVVWLLNLCAYCR